jgi:hypothetical protein
MTAKTQANGPVRLAPVGVVAGWLGVDPGLVTKWLTRYADDAEHPTPAPDFVAAGRHGDDRFWTPAREADWRTWQATRPSQGRPGQAKTRTTANEETTS